MNELNYLALAVPFFSFFILLEFWIARRQGKQYFNFSRVISNLNIAIAERTLDIFTAMAFYFFYDYLHSHFAIFDIPSTLFWGLVLLFCTDLVFYWYHRFGHEVNLLWSLHIVHHQSEDYNLSTGTRVTVFQAAVRTCFWAILPVVGFSAPMIAIVLIIHGTYPFFTHTRTVKKLGWLEYLFVTPSHHRVHHGTNEQYLDKNYSNIFIIWDKIFGTFKEEKEEPTYGITHQLESHSFLWQHFHYIFELWYTVKRAKGLREKLEILFGSPEKVDPQIREILERRFRIRNNKNTAPASNELNHYLAGQIVATMVFLFLFLLFKDHLTTMPRILSTLLILITLINCGALMDRQPWVFHMEYSRLFIAWLLMINYFPSPLLTIMIMSVVLIVVVNYTNLEQRYLKLLYR